MAQPPEQHPQASGRIGPMPSASASGRPLAPMNQTAWLSGDNPTSVRIPPGSAVRMELDRLLGRFTPAHIVIDSRFEIVQFHGNAGRYLELAPGAASLDLIGMLREGLRIPVRSTLRAASRRGAPVRQDNVKVRVNGGFEYVHLEVAPMRSQGRERWYLILFEPADADREPAALGDKPADMEIRRLRAELAQARESLRRATQEQEQSNGELRSASEEVQSANEELQSINEELEASREQLQASNDQLLEINDALVKRAEGLAALNEELGGLLASANVAIVMLDEDLRIRRFTAAARQLFGLIDADVGRAIADLRLQVECADMQSELRAVVGTGIAKRSAASDSAGERYTLRLRPCRSDDGSIAGAVIVACEAA